MIIPSVDISRGRTVQLVGGEAQALDAGDPRLWLDRFSVAGEVAVVDIDAARGDGSNTDQIVSLCAVAPCRIGGGIRDYETAVRWLDAGAAKIVIGTAAQPELLRRLPKERLIAALDARDGDVVTHGWRTSTGRSIETRMAELRTLVGGFLVTFVELEGRLGGTDVARAQRLVGAAGDARLTIAGGVTTAEEVAALDSIGADAQVGMALYTGRLTLGAAVAAPLSSDRPDGLIPTVVVDERGAALGLCWSSRDSLAQAVNERRGVYQSRTRGRWVKGETSGARQELIRVDMDCDRDALRFTVLQSGEGFCHAGTRSCWGNSLDLGALSRSLVARVRAPASDGNSTSAQSYTARLAADPALLRAKLVEEATELANAAGTAETVHEAADLLYFTLATLAARDVQLADVEAELARRTLRVTRRAGDAKPTPSGAAS